MRGYRLDVWDSHTEDWHSLHFRNAKYAIEDGPSHAAGVEEGFVQLAVTQPAPGAEPASDDLYLHEAIARWAGWSLAVEMPGKHLSRYADPDKAVPPDADDPDFRTNEPVTPFKLTTSFGVVEGTLPSLRFGRRYRLRARAVDLAGSGLTVDDPVAELLSFLLALPRDPEGFAYLRYEPVAAPQVVIRDESAVTGPGSAVDRLVIRTSNDERDEGHGPGRRHGRRAAHPSAADERRAGRAPGHVRHARREAQERRRDLAADLGARRRRAPAGGDRGRRPDEARIRSSPARASTRFPTSRTSLSRGAAIRDLPATPSGAIGEAPPAGAAGKVDYEPLSDPNPRPGSATLVSFGEDGDWKNVKGFRLVLGEPAAGDHDPRPSWDPVSRVLTVLLPKGTTTTVPLSSYLDVDDLKLMGQWQWLREHVEKLTVADPDAQHLVPGSRCRSDRARPAARGRGRALAAHSAAAAHARARGAAADRAARVHGARRRARSRDARRPGAAADQADLGPAETRPSSRPSPPGDARAQRRPTSWARCGFTARARPGSTSRRAGRIPSTTSPSRPRRRPIARRTSTSCRCPTSPSGTSSRAGRIGARVGYYDPEHDQIAFVRAGDTIGRPDALYPLLERGSPPPARGHEASRRHVHGDLSLALQRVLRPATTGSTSRGASEPLVVDVPASERPLAPSVVYVVPTFGWQRQVETNLKRSVRFGGGLRVYLERPWFSSGAGELLGVALWNTAYGTLDAEDRDKFKPFITQWGMDPIWKTGQPLRARR